MRQKKWWSRGCESGGSGLIHHELEQEGDAPSQTGQDVTDGEETGADQSHISHLQHLILCFCPQPINTLLLRNG